MLKLIVCMDAKSGIGKDNKLPWKVPGELTHFKNTTTGHTVVMGRKTHESIGRLLPNRDNIVLSHNRDLKIEGALVTDDIQTVLDIAKTKDVYIIGGKQIYDLFVDYYDELIITRLPDSYVCDTYLNLNLKFFKLSQVIKHEGFEVEYYTSIRNKVLFGKPAVDHIKGKLFKAVHKWGTNHPAPHLMLVQVGDNFASNIYIQNKVKLGESLGIQVTHKQFDNCSEATLIETLHQYNADPTIHGILVQLPLPAGFDTTKVCAAVDPIKDVDCFNPSNVGQLWIDPYAETVNAIPCTPYGIIQLMKYYKISLASKNVVIVGRSNIVGKPIASLLLKENCTIQICHSQTVDLKQKCKAADILIAALGKAKFITSEYLKQNAIVIDVGINRDLNNKVCGDVDFESVVDLVQFISPVPFGVGPMTLIMLFNNLLKCYAKQLNFSLNDLL